jgi:membrane protease YdiL (CAAX protease family)
MFWQLAIWVKKHPLTIYFILAFLITWIAIAPLVLSAQKLWAVSLPPVWHALGALGPIAAAFLVTALAEGKSGVADLLRRLGRWRVGGGWLLVAIGSPLLLFFLATLLLRITSGAWPDLSKITTGENATWAWIGSSLLFAVAYGFGEEVGWRGFALPRLQQGRTPVAATTILTIFWVLWHLPMFFYRFEFGLGVTIQPSANLTGTFRGAVYL